MVTDINLGKCDMFLHPIKMMIFAVIGRMMDHGTRLLREGAPSHKKMKSQKDHTNRINDPVAERGAVFFRAQDNLTNDLQKDLILRMGQLTRRPATHGLHVHPVTNDSREFGDPDPQSQYNQLGGAQISL